MRAVCMGFYYASFRLFAGQFVPLALLLAAMQNLSQVLPFRLMLYFPVQLILGKVSLQETLTSLALQAVWCVLAFFLFRLVWRVGVRRFSAVGA